MRGDKFFSEVAKRPPFTKLHPKLASFFKDYFSNEKAIRFGNQMVVNTNFPPYPSRAFDHLAHGFRLLGDADERRLYSVTLAVTNRCMFNCWHCYNAGRSQVDLTMDTLERVSTELQDLGTVMVTLTGGEPLLRGDLEEIAKLFDERSCVIVGTTGAGLTAERAGKLRDGGVFGVGISLDSTDEGEHDRMRGKSGAYRMALDAMATARRSGLYPYIVSVATREFLRPDHFKSFMRFAAETGALEVHLLEPSASGKLAGRTDVQLTNDERRLILDDQKRVARDDSLPILSSYAYLESPEAFGCGAGLTQLYIDGSGEVCPCQFMPMSFGNVGREPLAQILKRMSHCFRTPRASCLGCRLAGHIPGDRTPTPPEVSLRICGEQVPESHTLPRFFKIHSEARGEVGRDELESAYDRVHDDYDGFWLTEAAKPIDDLLDRITLHGDERVFEAGCGTGYATALLSEKVDRVLAVDISKGMLAQARKRFRAAGATGVRFIAADALETLGAAGPFDLVFSSWVLGYIPLRPFFAAASSALAKAGMLAFIVHKENSPRQPLEIFAELVARDPSVLLKRVAFDFPRDVAEVQAGLGAAGMEVEEVWEGAVVFHYPSAEDVLEHLLKSGAGTAFHDAIEPKRRAALTDQFVGLLAERRRRPTDYEVSHEYIACIARKP